MSIEIKWNKRALKQFDQAIEYIEEDSPKNADKVKKDILSRVSKLADHPQSHHSDKYKIHNDGSFRAFEIHHYRISYRYIRKEIRIIRVRHTKMNPLEY
jgi:plasmid stabilization system protein ParE